MSTRKRRAGKRGAPTQPFDEAVNGGVSSAETDVAGAGPAEGAGATSSPGPDEEALSTELTLGANDESDSGDSEDEDEDGDGDDADSEESEYSGLEDEDEDTDESTKSDDDDPRESEATGESIGDQAAAASDGTKLAVVGDKVRFDQMKGFIERDDEYDGFLKKEGTEDEAKPAGPKFAPGPMEVVTSDSDTSDDEHARDGIGKVPAHWYDDEDHVGYDLDGNKVKKTGKEKDRLDKFLAKVDDPNYGRTIIDPMTKAEIRLTDEEIDMIKRIQGGEFPDKDYNPYEDYVDFFTGDTMVTPVSSAPEPKNRFVPSKWEHKRIMKMVRAIRKGWLKPGKVVKKEPEISDIWKDLEGGGRKNAPVHIAAPKTALPGHEESYNPPEEYLLNSEEEREWHDMDPEDRPRNFIPQKHSSLRLVKGYERFVQERFQRCLDLYLCPRKIKQRIRVDPESLIPKLPKPEELQPFPTVESLVYTGHTGAVTCLSPDPSGQFLATGSADGTVRLWQVTTGRCVQTLVMETEVTSVAWCPNPAITVIVVGAGSTVYVINPKLGPRRAIEGTEKLIKPKPAAEDGTAKTALEWTVPAKGSADYARGVRFVLKHGQNIGQLTWHHKGNYFSSVMPNAETKTVFIHALLRQHSQSPLSKKSRDVQCVAFHPLKPFFFVATKAHIRVYNLQTQTLVKKLLSGSKWISSIAVHPQGDNLIIGTFDRRLVWFDLDLSVRPYKTLRYHKLALRDVCYHRNYPLFASCGDEATVHVFHGMVYNDLMQNALIVPVKILRGHAKTDRGLGVMACCFHPRQPWLFSAGADGTVRLFTN